jgi:hypothetical protein
MKALVIQAADKKRNYQEKKPTPENDLVKQFYMLLYM